MSYIFSTDFFSYNIPNWTTYLSRFKNKPNLKFLEIGSFQGRSAVWLLENILTHETSSITCIDTFEGSVEHHNNDEFRKLLPTLYDTFCHNIANFKNKVIIKKGMSQNVLKEMNDIYDCIYIDGDHSAAAVMQDAVLAFPLLKTGGILIFDDYKYFEHLDSTPQRVNIPKPAINAFLDIYSNKIQVLFKDNQVIVEKL